MTHKKLSFFTLNHFKIKHFFLFFLTAAVILAKIGISPIFAAIANPTKCENKLNDLPSDYCQKNFSSDAYPNRDCPTGTYETCYYQYDWILFWGKTDRCCATMPEKINRVQLCPQYSTAEGKECGICESPYPTPSPVPATELSDNQLRAIFCGQCKVYDSSLVTCDTDNNVNHAAGVKGQCDLLGGDLVVTREYIPTCSPGENAVFITEDITNNEWVKCCMAEEEAETGCETQQTSCEANGGRLSMVQASNCPPNMDDISNVSGGVCTDNQGDQYACCKENCNDEKTLCQDNGGKFYETTGCPTDTDNISNIFGGFCIDGSGNHICCKKHCRNEETTCTEQDGSLELSSCPSGKDDVSGSIIGGACTDGDGDTYVCCRKSGIFPDPDAINLKPDQLENINPLRDSSVFKEDRSPANVINQALNRVIFPLAGSILFLLLVYGGFQIISASLSGKQNYIDIGKQRITAAIIGFILLFVSYWLWRLVMLILGIAS